MAGVAQIPAIRLEGLGKQFRGGVVALDSVDLEVARGSTFGFIGPNGAGKTTAIRLMLDLIRPTSGRVKLLGENPRTAGSGLRSRIGYLPGELSFDERLTARQTLTFYSSLHDTPAERAFTIAERFGLDLDRKIGDLSRGNKQKVGIVQAFAHNPELVILDEPTSGLDPILQRSFHQLLKERSAEGLTVFLSSHVLSELQQVATEVGMIREGRLLAVRDIETMRREAPHKVMVRFAERPSPEMIDGLDGLDGVSGLELDGSVVRLLFRGEMDALVKALATREVVELHSTEPDLEETFLRMYGGQ
jgi:ABC-2 type transport system ATP-binding protein